ncbi:Vacuolar protein sorting-associated protein 13 [Sphaceloma murrayae]|uniref:Vacuolar protein sorting-associated protein 13 n=1 Tax=Sphaceloma murrayae TaxID=2082308 RepID=A0A2K1QNI9_9PEZI|nr:Vacuolar protein sorting-associated protein 13 [Sphaceloma murrayae]
MRFGVEHREPNELDDVHVGRMLDVSVPGFGFPRLSIRVVVKTRESTSARPTTVRTSSSDFIGYHWTAPLDRAIGPRHLSVSIRVEITMLSWRLRSHQGLGMALAFRYGDTEMGRRD